MNISQISPWNFLFFSNEVPGQSRGGMALQIPARSSPGARGRLGEEGGSPCTPFGGLGSVGEGREGARRRWTGSCGGGSTAARFSGEGLVIKGGW